MTAVILGLVLGWQVNVADLLKKCEDADDRNAEIERNYVFEERSETRQVDAKGKVKQKESETYDTILTGGRPYRRLVAKNDVPLSEAEIKRREARQNRAEAEGQDEQRRKRNRELAHDTLNAFDFHVVQEDAESWTLEGRPKPGFKPQTKGTAILRHFRGRIQISKKDYNWMRLDAEATDDISFGLVLFRLDKGAHIVVERNLVNGEVWLPRRIAGGGAGRVALVKKLRVEFETVCSKYKRYSADSRLVTDPVK